MERSFSIMSLFEVHCFESTSIIDQEYKIYVYQYTVGDILSFPQHNPIPYPKHSIPPKSLSESTYNAS